MSSNDSCVTRGERSDVKVQQGQGQLHQAATLARRFRAPVDIFENKDEILLYADLPGVQPNDLEVRLENGLLSIEGRRTWRGNGDQPQASWVYQRSFQLPGGTDGDKIQASLRGGVLELHLPKKEALKPRQIRVQAE